LSDISDRDLGMKRNITRRDFLNGVAVTAGAAMMPWHLFAADDNDPENSPAYYPPALTGLRGSHPGSFDVAHSLRDGTFWDTAGTPQDTGETYDLIVVGGGISGLSAAHFYRKSAGANARILILDNHDDFGGHAKRNEFRVGNAFRLGFGGTSRSKAPRLTAKKRAGLSKNWASTSPPIPSITTPSCIARWACARRSFSTKKPLARIASRSARSHSTAAKKITSHPPIGRPGSSGSQTRLWRRKPRAIWTGCITMPRTTFQD
jgi:NAD(P)-binding Rossmann-like domain